MCVIWLLFLPSTETPNNKPNVFTTKPRYKAGEKFKANCTSRHSKPAANLTWTINNHEVSKNNWFLSSMIK